MFNERRNLNSDEAIMLNLVAGEGYAVTISQGDDIVILPCPGLDEARQLISGLRRLFGGFADLASFTACPKCAGQGNVIISENCDQYDRVHLQWDTCDYCGGEGWVEIEPDDEEG